MPDAAPAATADLALARTLEMAAVFMIGDGLLGLLQPRRHVRLWRSDVGAVDALVRGFDRHPGRRRLYGAAQLAAGLLLAARQRRRAQSSAMRLDRMVSPMRR